MKYFALPCFLLIGFLVGNAQPSLLNLDNVSKILSALFSLAGLVLGYFFYMAKINHDSETSRKNRIRDRFRSMADLIFVVEENFLDIMNVNVASSNDLASKKDLLENALQNITNFLENNDSLLRLDHDDLMTFLAMNSYYENECVIYSEPVINNLLFILKNQPQVAHQKKDFLSSLNTAKRVCIQKSE